LLTWDRTLTRKDEFLVVYTNRDDSLPSVVFQATATFTPDIQVEPVDTILPAGFHSETAGTVSRILLPRPFTTDLQVFHGWLKYVRVCQLSKGSFKGKSKCSCFKLVGPIESLSYDLGRWDWILEGRPCGQLLAYSVQLGRKLLNHYKQLPRTIPVKWNGLLPPSYEPR
jgi:hypothetical protein